MNTRYGFWAKTLAVYLAAGIVLSASAAKSDDARAERKRLKAEAKELQEQGRTEEAQRLRQKAKRLGKAPERTRLESPGDRTSIARPLVGPVDEKIEREIQELHRLGRHDEANQLERQLDGRRRDRMEGPGSSSPRDPRDAQARLDHLNQAVGHLHAAGMHEPADRLAREAESLRREVERRDPGKPASGQDLEPMRRAMEDMSRRMDELRGQLDELRRFVKEQTSRRPQ